jgi:AcrR family transcriptional regulator
MPSGGPCRQDTGSLPDTLTAESNKLRLPPNRRPRDHGARPDDEQLLDGARHVFAMLGYGAATMQEIAVHAGCTKPTLYAHFRDKETIYQATVAREVHELEARLFATYARAESLPLHEQIRASMLVFFEYASAQPDGFRLLFGDQGAGSLATARAGLIAEIRTRITALTRGYAQRHGIALGRSAEILAAMMVAVAIDGAHQSVLVTPVAPEAAGELAAGFVESALRHLDVSLTTKIDRPASV